MTSRADDGSLSPLEQTYAVTRTAMFAALLAAGAYIVVPLGPTHFTLQTMMVMLTGFCLGPRRAFLALLLYLAAGCLGLPVFGRGRAGPAAFIAPTGGYFFGFVLGAVVCGFAHLVPGSRRRRIAAMAAAGLAGSAAILAAGSAWLRLTLVDDWPTALMVGAIPFIPLDIVKLALAICVKEAFFPPAEKNHA